MRKTIVVMIIFYLLIFLTDFTLSKLNTSPIFSYPLIRYKDGGSVEYYGLGYKIIKYRSIEGDIEGDGRVEIVVGFWSMKYER